ncbi:MAG: hypothetical protein SPE53_00060 [Prevotella sp.]|nr:hypothetical protein [Prevotella sp.]
MNNNFNIKRFFNTFVWTLEASKKELITSVVSLFFVFALVLTLGSTTTFFNNIEFASGFCTGLFFVYIMISGCWIGSNLKTKQQIIMYKMLPASNLERFLSRYLYITFIWIMGGILAFAAADLVQIIVNIIIGNEVKSSIPFIYIAISDGSEEGLPFIEFLAMYLVYVWIHSLYILGGVFFRKNQFVLTTLVNIVLAIVLTKIIKETGIFIFIDDIQTTFIIVFLILLIALNYYLSYKLFCRIQVINNKWINL